MINSPSGYVLRGKYRADRRANYLGSIILFVVSLCFLLLVHPEFTAFEFVRGIMLTSLGRIWIVLGPIFILAAICIGHCQGI
jgi:hypothetical protein